MAASSYNMGIVAPFDSRSWSREGEKDEFKYSGFLRESKGGENFVYCKDARSMLYYKYEKEQLPTRWVDKLIR